MKKKWLLASLLFSVLGTIWTIYSLDDIREIRDWFKYRFSKNED